MPCLASSWSLGPLCCQSPREPGGTLRVATTGGGDGLGMGTVGDGDSPAEVSQMVQDPCHLPQPPPRPYLPPQLPPSLPPPSPVHLSPLPLPLHPLPASQAGHTSRPATPPPSWPSVQALMLQRCKVAAATEGMRARLPSRSPCEAFLKQRCSHVAWKPPLVCVSTGGHCLPASPLTPGFRPH